MRARPCENGRPMAAPTETVLYPPVKCALRGISFYIFHYPFSITHSPLLPQEGNTMAFTKINIAEQTFNPFELISKQWMLISAGSANSWNTMTASWGGVGVIWGKPSATCYIRHSRYTKEFVDNNEYFTLTFLQDGHRDALNLLGSKSGRDMDKMHDSGLTPIFVDGQPTFAEAE